MLATKNTLQLANDFYCHYFEQFTKIIKFSHLVAKNATTVAFLSKKKDL